MSGLFSARRRVPPHDNPFRSERVDALGYVCPAGRPWAELEQRVRDAGFRGALVGAHGHGKSTLMHRLARLDAPCGREGHEVIQVQSDRSNLNAVKRALATGPPRLFLDGYDLLPWGLRRKIHRRPQVIVTSHFETRLPTLVNTQTDAELLGRLIQQLSCEVYTALGPPAIESLHRQHAGNVRNALRELYDRVAAGEFSV